MKKINNVHNERLTQNKHTDSKGKFKYAFIEKKIRHLISIHIIKAFTIVPDIFRYEMWYHVF